jgi:hypothetical protein
LAPISQIRFNALAGYSRTPLIATLTKELEWVEEGDERVLGVLLRDEIDHDFSGVVLGHDRLKRYRAITVFVSETSLRRAKAKLRVEMAKLVGLGDSEYYQGDERGRPVDFFHPIAPRKKLNPSFISLMDHEGYSSAREIIEPMMHWFRDPDGNFIEQFQTEGFNARIWELYLFSVFTEVGYALDRSNPAPDFWCKGRKGEFLVEAVTVNPTNDAQGNIVPPPSMDTPDQESLFHREFMPIKYGSALSSKLARAYWKMEHVKGKALALAIQDFHAPMSMITSRAALPIYLYGFDHSSVLDRNGKRITTPKKILEHRWGNKVIPSGFFFLPEASNISAVIFSNSGNISKFSRMGLLAGFGSPRIRLTRDGCATNRSPNAMAPTKFSFDVNAPSYKETWVEGLDVFHNPKAIHPLEEHLLPGAAHHRLQSDGQILSSLPNWHPVGSFTTITLADPN